VLLDFVQPGDTLVVTRIDRLARSMKNLQHIVHELKGRGVALRATEQSVDTGTAAGKAFLDMLGRLAHSTTTIRRRKFELCSLYPNRMPLRFAPPLTRAASCRPLSKCAAYSLASPTTPKRERAPAPSPAGNRCRPYR
jgi:resolvase-like protein